MKRSLWILVCLLFATPFYALGLSEPVRALIAFETHANPAQYKRSEPYLMEHLEIPLYAIDTDFAERLDPEIKKNLIFTKDGREYVRWILDPEDTKWGQEVIEYFKSKGVSLHKGQYFTGHPTASRSYIIEDPKQSVVFSFKGSTNHAGGRWQDKKQEIAEAQDARLAADILYDLQKRLRFENVVIMDEPAILKLGGINQSMMIRDLGDFSKPGNNKYYVPGFSVLHNHTGKAIAERNGSSDPHAYWTEHYIKSVGRALGELAARSGVQLESPHSQNFLVEFDNTMKPTGRIVIRDLSDIFIDYSLLEAYHPDGSVYKSRFNQKMVLQKQINAGFGPLHGSKYPQWLNAQKYHAWAPVFFRAFEESFAKQSGLAPQQFRSTAGGINGAYFSNTYKVIRNTSTAGFWSNLKNYSNPTGKLNCSFVFEF